MEYRELAEKSGITHWRRVPALNTDERFIADMADMVVSSNVTVILYISHADIHRLCPSDSISFCLALTHRHCLVISFTSMPQLHRINTL